MRMWGNVPSGGSYAWGWGWEYSLHTPLGKQVWASASSPQASAPSPATGAVRMGGGESGRQCPASQKGSLNASARGADHHHPQEGQGTA